MAVIGEKELRAQLKSGTLSHAYFIYGDWVLKGPLYWPN